MTAHTGTASTVPEPIGKPGGPGLWHHKGLQLPPYIQHVAHHLLANGMDEGKAIEEAVGIVRNWAEGHDGHGHPVHPDVQAAAAKNIAQWEADKAKGGKARRSTVTITAERADKKPYGDVTYADPKNGKYPLDTEAHVRAAWAYINVPKNAGQYPMNGVTLAEVKAKIKAAMDKLGADMDDSKAGASRMQRQEIFRTYGLEDAHIVRTGEGDGTGRVVEAYCAVFDDPVEIHDQQGHYIEDIDRAAFNKRIEDVRRARAGFTLVKVMYNHGLTIHGTPAERFSMPCAVTEHISAEGKGVLTRARYLDTALGNEVLELWRSGAITAQSFTGATIRSSPELRRGDLYRPRGGELPRVRRLEMGLREFGGTPFPAYDGAELVGVRMSPVGTWQAADDDEYEEAALPPDGEAAAGEPLTRTDGDEHSARYHQHELYRMTSEEKRKAAGLVW